MVNNLTLVDKNIISQAIKSSNEKQQNIFVNCPTVSAYDDGECNNQAEKENGSVSTQILALDSKGAPQNPQHSASALFDTPITQRTEQIKFSDSQIDQMA